MNKTGLLIGIFLAAVFSGILIWVVGLLGLGLQVDGLGTAFIAGFAIAVIGGAITWLLSLRGIKLGSGIRGAIINVLLGAVVLLLSDRFLAGLSVNGFAGALVASVAIGVISWLVSMPLKRINQKAAAQEARRPR